MPMAAGNRKLCPKCGETKGLDAFGRDSKRLDGLKPWCKACRKAENASDYREHKVARDAAHKEWKVRNPGKMSGYSKAWVERNPEKRKAIDDARNAARDPKVHCAEVMESYWRNPKRHLDRSRKWRAANREIVAAITKAYRQANPEFISALKRSYKARKNGAEGSHSGEDIKRILEEQKWICVYCPTSLVGAYHVDHIIPLSRGGSNWPNNLQCLCPSCNLRKKDKDPIEFARSLE